MITAESNHIRYHTTFTNGTHEGVSDTTETNGGGNVGFRPHDLLEAALASCLNIWVRMYADAHSIPLERVTATVCLDRSRPEKAVFKYAIDLKGAITEDERLKLLGIAKTCPVHRTLSGAIALEPQPAIEMQ